MQLHLLVTRWFVSQRMQLSLRHHISPPLLLKVGHRNWIFYSKEQFSKLIFARITLLHWPCEACENSNTDIEELLSYLWKILKAYFLFWVEKFDVLEKGFSMRLETNPFSPLSSLIRKNVRRKYREDEHGRKKVKYMGLYSTDTAFPQHKHDKFSLKAKGEKTRLSWPTANSSAASVLLRILLVKRMVSIKTRTCALWGQWPFTFICFPYI